MVGVSAFAARYGSMRDTTDTRRIYLHLIPHSPKALCHDFVDVGPVEGLEANPHILHKAERFYGFVIPLAKCICRLDPFSIMQLLVESPSQIKQIGDFPLLRCRMSDIHFKSQMVRTHYLRTLIDAPCHSCQA